MNVTITAPARRMIREELSRYRPYHAALVVARQVPTGELTRGPHGEALWRINRPDGWEAVVAEVIPPKGARSKGTLPLPFTSVDGVPVVLDPKSRASLVVHVRNGKLHVQGLSPLAKEQ